MKKLLNLRNVKVLNKKELKNIHGANIWCQGIWCATNESGPVFCHPVSGCIYPDNT